MKFHISKYTNKYEFLPKKYIKYNPIKSFGYAFEGLFLAFWRETSVRIQFLLMVTLVIFCLWSGHLLLSLSHLLLGGIIIGFEIQNSAIELICDLVEPNQNPVVKIIKDLSSGAVLCVALVWLVVILYSFGSIFLHLFVNY